MYVNDILMTECEERNVMRLIKKLKMKLVKDDKGMLETEKEKVKKVNIVDIVQRTN